MTAPPPFSVRAARAPARPIVGHVPHASTMIPDDERARLLPDAATLDAELLRLTDRHTDRLYDWIRDLGGRLLVNGVSRLVVDPERFPDDAGEPMAAVGQGAIYTRTSSGAPLRSPDAADRERLLARWYAPYHDALAALVEESLVAHGECLIVDGHSFASLPLPHEPDATPDRPDVCLGTDPFHTPPGLVSDLRAALQAEGFRVAIDRPFAGSLVPGRWYRVDPRVRSVMLEVRRGTYMDEATGEPLAGFDDVAGRLARSAGPVLLGYRAGGPG